MRLAAKRVPLRSGNDICKLCNANVLAKLCLILYPDEAHEKTCLSLAVSLNHMDIISSIYVFLLFAVVATGHLEAGRLNAHVPPIHSWDTLLHCLPSEQILKCWWFSLLISAEKDTL